METENYTLIDGTTGVVQTGIRNIDQVVDLSFQVILHADASSCIFKLDVSNDPDDLLIGNLPANWTNIFALIIGPTNSSYEIYPQITTEWYRIKLIPNNYVEQTGQFIADTGAILAQSILCFGDTSGSLNSTYFTLSSVNLITKAQKDWYVWYDNGSGIDPHLPGRTGIQVTYANNASATTIRDFTSVALDLLSNDFSSSFGPTTHVLINCLACGAVPPAADGADPTLFFFEVQTPGADSNLNSKYFKIFSAFDVHSYAVWANVDNIGTNPTPAGFISVPVPFSSGSDAPTVATAYITALNLIAEFSAGGGELGFITIVNIDIGPATPIINVDTPYTFVNLTPVGSAIVTIKTNLG